MKNQEKACPNHDLEGIMEAVEKNNEKIKASYNRNIVTLVL